MTRITRILAVLILAWATFPLHALDAVSSVRLQVLACGSMSIKDMRLFSDTGKYDGRSGWIVDTCFLIRHPKGILLWDTGLSDALLGHDVPANVDGVALHVEPPLLEQLLQVGVSPAHVTYLAFSHLHIDHTGNANAFGSAPGS